MTDQLTITEGHVRKNLSALLRAAADNSGRTRCDIAREANIHKDALRRILMGTRAITVSEALRILNASGASAHAHMLLFFAGGGERATEWLRTDLALFFEDVIRELPPSLERQLGNQLHDLKPRWAKGTAQRIARLLGDHLDEMARKDGLLGGVYDSERSRADA